MTATASNRHTLDQFRQGVVITEGMHPGETLRAQRSGDRGLPIVSAVGAEGIKPIRNSFPPVGKSSL